jgi:hypothetical protein
LGRRPQLKLKIEIPPSRYFWRDEAVIVTTYAQLL